MVGRDRFISRLRQVSSSATRTGADPASAFGSRQSRSAESPLATALRNEASLFDQVTVESKLESLGIRFSEKMGAAGLRGVSVEHSPGTSAPCGSCNILTPDAETAVAASRSAAAELDPIGAQPALVVIDGVAAIKCGPEPLGSVASSDQSGIVTVPPVSSARLGRYSKQDVNAALSGFKSWPGDKRNRNVLV